MVVLIIQPIASRSGVVNIDRMARAALTYMLAGVGIGTFLPSANGVMFLIVQRAATNGACLVVLAILTCCIGCSPTRIMFGSRSIIATRSCANLDVFAVFKLPDQCMRIIMCYCKHAWHKGQHHGQNQQQAQKPILCKFHLLHLFHVFPFQKGILTLLQCTIKYPDCNL